MRVTHDAGADIAYLYLKPIRPGESARQHVVEDEATPAGDVILDFDEDDRLIGIEFLTASKQLPPELLERAEKVS